MFEELPIEINYKILNGCTNATIATIGLINKTCYVHILDPIESFSHFYPSSKNLSLFKLILTIKLGRIFNKTATYVQNRKILIETYKYVQVETLYGINKDNINDFIHWFESIDASDTIGKCIFMSDKIIICFNDYYDWHGMPQSQYFMFDKNNKILIRRGARYNPEVHVHQDYFYFDHSTTIKKEYLSTMLSRHYFDPPQKENLSNTKFSFIEYVVSRSESEVHSLINRKHIKFWYVIETYKYNIVAVSTKSSERQTNVDLVLIDKNILVNSKEKYTRLDIASFSKYSFQTSSFLHPKYIKACYNNSESKLYILVLNAISHELSLQVFDLQTKSFVCKCDFINRPCPKEHPISFDVVDDRYVLITFFKDASLLLYWVRIRANIIDLESIETYKAYHVNNIHINKNCILIQEHNRKPTKSYIYSFY